MGWSPVLGGVVYLRHNAKVQEERKGVREGWGRDGREESAWVGEGSQTEQEEWPEYARDGSRKDIQSSS